MGQDGKTLMEIMAVVAVIGLSVGMAVPSFLPLLSRNQMHAVTQELASELRLARQLAMTSRDRVRVVFDRDQRAIASELVNSARIHHVYRYVGTGIDIEEPTAGPEIVFHPSGRSATATTIELRHRDGHIRKLTVSLTGRVAVL